MQNWKVQPAKRFSGNFRVDGDKSISHRAVMLAAIADGVSQISGFLEGEDCLATMRAYQEMGVEITKTSPSCLTVVGRGLHGLSAPKRELDLGNSGTAMRLMCGMLAGQKFDSILVGDSSLMSRPMKRVTDPLTMMGACIEASEKGTAPLKIYGRSLRGIDYSLPIASAQLKSALLFASLYAQGRSIIRENIGVSRDHSEKMLKTFAVHIDDMEPNVLRIDSAQSLKATEVKIPADISSAAFFIAAAMLSEDSEILLEGVGINPTRAAVIDIFQMMGGNIQLENKRFWGAEPIADIRVKSSKLHGIDIPERFVPIAIDEFPIIFIVAACAQGVTRASSLAELRVKESDRLAVMEKNLQKLAVKCKAGEQDIEINGKSEKFAFCADEVQIDSYGDHRIAMSFAVASLKSQNSFIITDTANVATSFPNFLKLSKEAGLCIDLMEM